MLKPIPSLNHLDAAMAEAASSGGEQARVAFLVDHVLDDPTLIPRAPDPFSTAYRDEVAAIHGRISRRDGYRPDRDELIDIDPATRAKRPGIYTDGGSRHLGTFLEAIGQIFQVADLRPGQKVVEYGPGDGQIIVPLARMGCRTAAVDIEERYLETITRQVAAFDGEIDVRRCAFSADPGLRDFDLAIFFEAFHHAIDHQQVLHNLHKVLGPDGRILFAGEPIIERDSPWERVVPAPWCLRLDGLSASAIRHYGWMELGFQERYFVELLLRCGWLVEKHPSATNGRGTCYVARRMGQEIDLRAPILIEAHDAPGGWSGPEPRGRWTGPQAILPLPVTQAASWDVEILFHNPLGLAREITVSSTGGGDTHLTLAPEETRTARLAGASGRLRIAVGNPVDLSQLTGGQDRRVVGCFAERIALHAP